MKILSKYFAGFDLGVLRNAISAEEQKWRRPPSKRTFIEVCFQGFSWLRFFCSKYFREAALSEGTIACQQWRRQRFLKLRAYATAAQQWENKGYWVDFALPAGECLMPFSASIFGCASVEFSIDEATFCFIFNTTAWLQTCHWLWTKFRSLGACLSWRFPAQEATSGGSWHVPRW